MRLRAFAKINLDLHILDKRPDGFHEIRTIFQTIDWFDEIEIEQADRFKFSASDGPQDERNLVVRAVRFFEKASGTSAKVRIRLTKNIPTGAGLGGGSSDAAATLIGLQRLFNHSVPAEDVRSLGSDVPFFMVGGRVLGTGRGDQIGTLSDQGGYWLVLVNPGFSISTSAAYSWLTLPDKSNKIEGFCLHSISSSNDFEEPVFGRFTELRSIRDELLRSGAFNAALSGSGSVVFGQFRSEAEAEQVAQLLSARYSVKVTRPLPRAEYLSRMIG